MATPAKLKLAVVAVALSTSGLLALKGYEGTNKDGSGRHTAYVDTGGVVTICYGHTLTAKLGQQVSDSVCDELLRQDIRWAEAAVKHHVRVPITQGQYDALVSFTYNVGEQQFSTSTLLRLLNAGNCYGAAKQFDRWVMDNGVVYRGLVLRRADERSKFEPGCAP